ncbi:phosphotransferase [Herbiconiux sp. A18JL235]|uniref:Phosphotransferase n=1 Tax=Herbiconiux sp. A18JL235 TaxID=3152363 RepID=A0AB39BEZ4_9MICO
MTADDVVRYLDERGLLGRVATSRSSASVREVTAGNMNRVFIASGPEGSLAVKQAPPWVQVVGPEWPIDPSRIVREANTYEQLAGSVPDSIPTIVSFDPERYVLVMEDLSDLVVLRDALVAELEGRDAGVDYTALGHVVGRFVGELAAGTSAAALGGQAHAELIERSANPELCALTLDVVLDEPYRPHEHNRWHPVLDERVRSLYRDEAVRGAVARIRSAFEQQAEALLHGDLHSGSVMVGRRDGEQLVKVFDPEFSFVGPIGMDLGLFWANLEIAAIAARAVGRHELAAARYSAIAASLDAFAAAWGDDETLPAIVSDGWSFAGVEGMRRAAGFSHAADIESLPEPARAEASARLFEVAREHILTGAEAVHPFAVAPGSAAAASALAPPAPDAPPASDAPPAFDAPPASDAPKERQ